MSDIYQELLSALEKESQVMLATIISTSGSTPASALSKMMVKNGGVTSVGTVGGGCMEGEVLLHARRLFETGKAEILTFHLNEDDSEDGLICGGSLDVLIEPITRNHFPVIQQLTRIREDGEDSILCTIISLQGDVTQKFHISSNDFRHSLFNPMLSRFLPEIEHVFSRRETKRVNSEGEIFVFEPVAGTPHLIIFGGGHVSKFISRSAATIGFRVTVIDDRERYANPDRFPEAIETMAVDFIEAFQRVAITASTYIIIVTRGHKHDEIILEQAVKTGAKYIGMIGSKRKVLKTFEHLVEKGLSVETLRKVFAPVGIEIGAITPEEIAVSIVAQLIRVRRGESGLCDDKAFEIQEFLYTLDKQPLIA